MNTQVSTRLVILGILAACFTWNAAGYAQAPYWDNSGDSGNSYYSPGTSGNNNNSNTNNTYGQPANNNNYGQPNNYNNNSNNYSQPNNSYGNSNNYGNSYNQPQAQLRGYVSTAPAGTSLSVTTTSYLSSESSHIGDPVSATLSYDLAMGGNIILPSGTQIQGQVVSSVPAGRTGRHGEIQLRFNSALLPDGRQVPLSARLVTTDGTGVLHGGTRAGRAGNVAKNTLGGAVIGAGSGAALGAIVGGGHKWNEGLLWGSILGAGGGLARSAVQRGEEAEVQPGTQLQLMLDQPLNVTSTNGGQNAPANSGGYPY